MLGRAVGIAVRLVRGAVRRDPATACGEPAEGDARRGPGRGPAGAGGAGPHRPRCYAVLRGATRCVPRDRDRDRDPKRYSIQDGCTVRVGAAVRLVARLVGQGLFTLNVPRASRGRLVVIPRCYTKREKVPPLAEKVPEYTPKKCPPAN